MSHVLFLEGHINTWFLVTILVTCLWRINFFIKDYVCQVNSIEFLCMPFVKICTEEQWNDIEVLLCSKTLIKYKTFFSHLNL